jgi:hypothetical protein
LKQLLLEFIGTVRIINHLSAESGYIDSFTLFFEPYLEAVVGDIFAGYEFVDAGCYHVDVYKFIDDPVGCCG